MIKSCNSKKENIKMFVLRNLLVLIAFFYAGLLVAGDVLIDYATVGLYSNHVSKVNSHDDFVFYVKFPEGTVVSRIYYRKTPSQTQNKNRLLSIGIDEYKNKIYMPDVTCSEDARIMTTPNSYYKTFGGSSLLTNKCANKVAIRQKIEEAAAEMGSEDSFLFYYSGRTENNSSLLAYDMEYTFLELAEDLGQFTDAVKIILILNAVDIDKCFNELPMEFISNPNLIVVTCSRNNVKNNKGCYGSFVTAWGNANHNYLTDFNKDSYMSFYEMIKRIESFFKAKKIKEKINCFNDNLARELFYFSASSPECYGDININPESRELTFVIPDVDHNAVMTVEAPTNYYENLTVSPKKSKFNINLISGPPYVTKFTFDFESIFFVEDQHFSLMLNNEYIPIIGEVKMKKDGKSGTFTLQDRCFKNIGTLKFQYNNGRYYYKLKLTDKETLSEALEKSSGPETVELMVRHGWHIGAPCKLTYDKKYKDGKSLSAKLQTQE